MRVASRLSMFRDKPGQLAYQTLALMFGNIFPKKTSFYSFQLKPIGSLEFEWNFMELVVCV